MKNFTNYLKQKTNPTWIRILTLFLLFALGVNTVFAAVDVYVFAPNASSNNAYIWTGTSTTQNGSWPGNKISSSFTSLGNKWYKKTINTNSSYNIIFNNGSKQTSDIKSISTVKYFGYPKDSGTDYTQYNDYGTASNYKLKNSWGNDVAFSSFSETKQAFTMSEIELTAGDYTMQVYKGSSKYWSSFDNNRGTGVTLSGGGANGYSFTLSSKGKVTFYYDPGADVAFATFESSCNPPAEPTLNPNSTTVCSGTPFDLPSGYRWYTEQTGGTKLSSNRISSGVTTQTVYYAEAGEDGCVSKTRTPYTVNVDAKSALSLTNKTICDGTTINLGDCVASNTGDVTWYSNSGLTTVVSNLDVTPHTNPTYYYAVAKNGVCANSATQTLTITVDPQPAIELSETEITICNGETVAFPSYIKNYEGTVTWYKDDAMSQAVGSVTAKPTVTTTYYAKVVSGVCTNYETASLKVNVNDKPAKPTISAKDDKTALVSGESTVLSVNNAVEGVTYTWYRENSGIVHTGATYTTSVAGKYTVKANANNGCGDSEVSDAIEITVCVPISNLKWEIREGGKDVYCSGDVVKVKMTYDGDKATAYQWGGDFSGKIGISGYDFYSGVVYTMTVNKTGSVIMTLTGCNGTPVSTEELQFTVASAPQKPEVSFSANPVGQSKPTTLTVSPYDAAFSYVIKKDGEEVGAYTAPTTITIDEFGKYSYTVTATSNVCSDLTETSDPVVLEVQEAGAKIEALGDLKVDPQDPVDFVAMYVKNDGLADYTDQGATKVTGYTWQFYNDDDKTWMDCASTNAVAGVTYSIIGMENGSKNCNNFRPSAPGKYRCKVTYDKGEQTSNVLTVTGDGSTAKTFKGVTMNIPVISVNTGKEKFPTCDGLSGTASKNADVIKEKISVDVKIFAKVGENIEVVYDRKARMNYRGSSSLNFVKKSYAFCTGKEKTKNDKGAVDTGKENLFGLSNGAKDKDWVLYAAAADPSIMRNRLMFDTFRDMTGGWSVNSMYVELVINGEYKGVYVLMDKITANEKRVNVAWKQDINGKTTQEGFIVKFDKTDIVDRYENTSGDQKTFKSTYSGHDGFTTYDTQIDQRFEIEYPEKEDIEEEDLDNNKGAGEWSEVFNTIKEKFNKFEYELAKGNFSEVQKLIDYQSWADWFIITEFGKNIDGYRASNLFVYDGSKPNAKIEARPLWDQELSFDNQCPNYYAKYGANSESGFMVDKSNDEAYNNDASTPFWFTGRYTGGRGTYNGSNQTFKGLLDDPCFVAMVKTRWETHKANALSESNLNTKLEAYTTEMGAAKDREATFWSTRSRSTCQCSYSGSTGYVNDISFTDSKKAITEWIGKRPAGLTKAIDELKGLDLTISLTVTPDGGITTPWEAVMVQVNNPSGYDYDLNYTTNTLDKVEGVIINENNDKYTYRIPRPSTWGTGDGERAAIEYGIQAILNVADDNLQCGTINEELTKADVTITLKDEEDDDCSIVEP